MLFMIMKSDFNKLVCIFFSHLSAISLENFKDRALIIPEILGLIKLHTYMFGLVYKNCVLLNILISFCIHIIIDKICEGIVHNYIILAVPRR